MQAPFLPSGKSPQPGRLLEPWCSECILFRKKIIQSTYQGLWAPHDLPWPSSFLSSLTATSFSSPPPDCEDLLAVPHMVGLSLHRGCSLCWNVFSFSITWLTPHFPVLCSSITSLKSLFQTILCTITPTPLCHWASLIAQLTKEGVSWTTDLFFISTQH